MSGNPSKSKSKLVTAAAGLFCTVLIIIGCWELDAVAGCNSGRREAARTRISNTIPGSKKFLHDIRPPKARLYSGPNYNGHYEDFNFERRPNPPCLWLKKLGGQVKSMNTFGTCVRLYFDSTSAWNSNSNSTCGGFSIAFYPRIHKFLPDSEIRILKQSQAIGPCLWNELDESFFEVNEKDMKEFQKSMVKDSVDGKDLDFFVPDGLSIYKFPQFQFDGEGPNNITALYHDWEDFDFEWEAWSGKDWHALSEILFRQVSRVRLIYALIRHQDIRLMRGGLGGHGHGNSAMGMDETAGVPREFREFYDSEKMDKKQNDRMGQFIGTRLNPRPASDWIGGHKENIFPQTEWNRRELEKREEEILTFLANGRHKWVQVNVTVNYAPNSNSTRPVGFAYLNNFNDEFTSAIYLTNL